MRTLDATSASDRAEGGALDAVWSALDAVTDPELDASVTEMGFVESVDIKDSMVDIVFRLPTFWCSANFAYMMALDMKAAVEALPYALLAHVRLVDHFAAARINRGVAEGLDFADLYQGEASAGLREIRAKFRQKAFLGRQERLLRILGARHGAKVALATTMAELTALAGTGDEELRPLAQRFLTARRLDGGDASPGRPAFTTLEGERVAPEAYGDHLRALRRARSEAEANAELCRIQIAARYHGVAPGVGTALLPERTCHD